jgi:hypothetical protein
MVHHLFLDVEHIRPGMNRQMVCPAELLQKFLRVHLHAIIGAPKSRPNGRLENV